MTIDIFAAICAAIVIVLCAVGACLESRARADAYTRGYLAGRTSRDGNTPTQVLPRQADTPTTVLHVIGGHRS